MSEQERRKFVQKQKYRQKKIAKEILEERKRTSNYQNDALSSDLSAPVGSKDTSKNSDSEQTPDELYEASRRRRQLKSHKVERKTLVSATRNIKGRADNKIKSGTSRSIKEARNNNLAKDVAKKAADPRKTLAKTKAALTKLKNSPVKTITAAAKSVANKVEKNDVTKKGALSSRNNQKNNNSLRFVAVGGIGIGFGLFFVLFVVLLGFFNLRIIPNAGFAVEPTTLRDMKTALTQSYDAAVAEALERTKEELGLTDEQVLLSTYNYNPRTVFAIWYIARQHDADLTNPDSEINTGISYAINTHSDVWTEVLGKNADYTIVENATLDSSDIVQNLWWYVRWAADLGDSEALDQYEVNWSDYFLLEDIAGNYNNLFVATEKRYETDNGFAVTPEFGSVETPEPIEVAFILAEEPSRIEDLAATYSLTDEEVAEIYACLAGEDDGFNFLWAYLNANDSDTAVEYSRAIAGFAYEMWCYFGRNGEVQNEELLSAIRNDYSAFWMDPKGSGIIGEGEIVDADDYALWGQGYNYTGRTESWQDYFYRCIGHSWSGAWCNAFVSFCVQHGNGLNPALGPTDWGHAFPFEYNWMLSPELLGLWENPGITIDRSSGIMSYDMLFSLEELERQQEAEEGLSQALEQTSASSRERIEAIAAELESAGSFFQTTFENYETGVYSLSQIAPLTDEDYRLWKTYMDYTDGVWSMLLDEAVAFELGETIVVVAPEDFTFSLERAYQYYTNQASAEVPETVPESLMWWMEEPYISLNMSWQGLSNVPAPLYLHTDSYMVSFADWTTGAGAFSQRDTFFANAGGLNGVAPSAGSGTVGVQMAETDVYYPSISGAESFNGNFSWQHEQGSYIPNFSSFAWPGTYNPMSYAVQDLGVSASVFNALNMGQGTFADLLYVTGYGVESLNSNYRPIFDLLHEIPQRQLAFYPASQTTCAVSANWYANRGWLIEPDAITGQEGTYIPEAGDLIYYHRNEGINHVGIVIGTYDINGTKYIISIEGNASNTISMRVHTIPQLSTLNIYFADIPY